MGSLITSGQGGELVNAEQGTSPSTTNRTMQGLSDGLAYQRLLTPQRTVLLTVEFLKAFKLEWNMKADDSPTVG